MCLAEFCAKYVVWYRSTDEDESTDAVPDADGTSETVLSQIVLGNNFG